MDSQNHDRPIIVQSDKTILLEVHSPDFNKARNDISGFAELLKSPEHVHTYKLSPLSLWNAASIGITADDIVTSLQYWSRYPVPESILFSIRDIISKYGLISLHKVISEEAYFYLYIPSKKLNLECRSRTKVKDLLLPVPEEISQSSQILDLKPDTDIQFGFFVHHYNRGELKLQLMKAGYPVDDLVPLKKGAYLDISFRTITSSGYPFILRNYQREACDAFIGNGKKGFGTLVLPCGSGKTIIGIAAMEAFKTNTLIVTTNIAAVHQWIYELLDKTNLTKDLIGEYSGDRKEILPITICTYQILTWRKDKESDFPHFSIFRERDWGLILYDEVHVLPAPVFKVTAEIQALSRLGLTATLVREDNREDEVFSLVGPKRYDVPWKELEQKGWISEAHCYEIRVPLKQSLELDYAIGSKRQKYRIASENPIKTQVVKQLIENHKEDYILIIGQYLLQLSQLAEELHLPLITGATPNSKREELFNKFRKKELHILIVSKVANFAIDLPDASVAIQISGTFGSRQEEAQRLGRILRPKEHGSYFYSLITRYTSEEEFAANRQKFLAEQGYKYHIEIWD